MVKLSKRLAKNRLRKEKRQELLVSLCEAISIVRNSKEAANILTDLLSPKELEMIAKRLQIAKLLLDGRTYNQIQSDLRVGRGTVSRVNIWLSTSGEGFRLVSHRTSKRAAEHPKHPVDPFSWTGLKRRYPLHFWPEEALKELIQTASKVQRKRVLEILAKSNEKPQLFKELEETLKQAPHPKS